MNWKIWVLRVTLIGCLLAAGAAVWGYKSNWWKPAARRSVAGFEPAQSVQTMEVGTGVVAADREHGWDGVRLAVDHRQQRSCGNGQGREL